MENRDLYQKLEEKVIETKRLYEEKIEDSFWSVILHTRMETFQWFQKRLQEGETPETMLETLKEKLPGLEEAREQESEHPSFDWYDEHYHYKILDGQCDAYKAMIQILEQELETE